MEEITIPYHLVIPSLVCLTGLIVILFKRKKLFGRNKVVWISVTVFLVLYLLIVGGATYDDIHYQFEMNRLDLDKDGLFSQNEMTKEFNNVMSNVSNDTGRNFSFITGFFFALIISIVVYVLGRLLFRKQTLRPKENHT